jgi:hypothetical protein
VLGPDGNLWFTEFFSDKIGRLVPPGTTLAPTSGPAGGGTAIAIAGFDFAAGATVSVGGANAGDTSYVGPTRMTAATPALSPGTLADLKIIRPDGSMAIGPQAWLSDFLDVPPPDAFHDFVEAIFRRGITAGCGAGSYCRNAPVTRAQMAVFLLKAKHGKGYSAPPPCSGVFADVPCPSPFADWIEELAAEGITGGCGGGNYCPNAAVTRQQMAVFLLKALEGSGYVPSPCSGVFTDVPCPGVFADWVEQIYASGITGGCSTNPLKYCPGSAVTRGQMAVFLTKTFFL